MRITDFKVYDAKGNLMLADAFGNNVAFNCKCGHPVLAIALKGWRGNDVDNPAECKSESDCKKQYYLKVCEAEKKIIIV